MMIPRGTYSNELFEVEIKDFNKNYEFYEKIGIDELVKHKESKLIYNFSLWTQSAIASG